MAGAVLTAALVAPAATAVAATPAPHWASSAAAAEAAALVRTQKLVDGSTAKIYKLGPQHYRMQIVYRGQVYATLEANKRDTGVNGNGMFVVLTFDGEVHSWIGGGHQGPGAFRLPDGSTAKVTKLGPHHYKAQIIYRGSVYATLEANERDTGVNGNGMFIVLTADGEISASIR
ncbi:hypothetical protein [Streptomyces colonosanans]|uniref:Uncharacterized protein n=1 Tax=Streptomyces colonosanans TaxID=1428652 RepID=A0A1S2P7I5_9ACTN|nr:hypothetical protein [Streptomyces colonosanans]OIJ89783.1 hypothetical protein BIV24_19410 [Streptomyces colonosanans]